MSEALLRVSDLAVGFKTEDGTVRAVEGVGFEVPRGGTLAVVGESGCGKSVTALSILRLLPAPAGYVERGTIEFEGVRLLDLSEREMRKRRGKDIAMIFQEPMSSLNPVYSVGTQIAETLRAHQRLSRKAAWARAVQLLGQVGIPAPEERVRSYPHELSGGMRQRVMIAIALSCGPKLLLADEPTTALDVTIQAQILALLKELQREFHMSIVLITHDLGIVAEFAESALVMYAGKVVEEAPTRTLFRSPAHPYTKGLLASLPDPGRTARRKRLETIPGVVPDLRALPRGCRFQDRCPDVIELCREREPALTPISNETQAACFVAAERARQGSA